MGFRITLLAAVVLVAAAVDPGAAQQSEEELAKAVQNPVANLISLPLQNNTNFNIGRFDRTQNVLNVQPVWPFGLEKWNIITRTIAPIIRQPNVRSSSGSVSGLGDINFTAFVSPAEAGRIIWGVGPVLSLPTATDDEIASDKWGIGPSAVVLAMPAPWVLGVLFNNIWSFAGDSDAPDVNKFLLQYFITSNLKDGWYIVSAPIITANWEADSDQRWIVPFGGGAGKIFKLGKQPLNGQVSAYYNAVKPDIGPDWQLRAQLQFIFPK